MGFQNASLQFFPLLYRTVSLMVNRNGIQSFVLFAVALFSQQSQFPVWTKCLNMQRLNNLSPGDRKNIHFMATCESVYLRQQTQILEWGEAKLKKNQNNVLQETKGYTWKLNKTEFSFPLCQHLIWAWHWVLVSFFFFLLKLFDSAVTMKSNIFYISPFVFVIFIYFHFIFIWRGVLMRNQLSTPKFINTSDATIWFTICPHAVNSNFFHTKIN